MHLDNRDAYIVRSRIFARLNDYPKAIDDVSKILHDSAEDKEMYVLRGTYYQEFTQYGNAIGDFSHALLIDKAYVDAYYRRAFSYEQTGDFKLAIKDYETLTRLSNTDPKARTAPGGCAEEAV